MLFTLPNLDSWTIEQIYDSFGKPTKNVVSRLDDQPLGPEVPPYTVEPAYFWSPDKEALRTRIKIIDFGEASFSNERRKHLHTPMSLRAPESFFGEEIGLPIDIWAFACTVFDVFGRIPLFEAFRPNKDNILFAMVEILGKFPNRWWEKWENRGYYLFPDGTRNTDIVTRYLPEAKPLGLCIHEIRLNRKRKLEETAQDLSAEDLAGLKRLLAPMLTYEPSERATIEDCLTLNWVQQLLQESKMQ